MMPVEPTCLWNLYGAALAALVVAVGTEVDAVAEAAAAVEAAAVAVAADIDACAASAVAVASAASVDCAGAAGCAGLMSKYNLLVPLSRRAALTLPVSSAVTKVEYSTWGGYLPECETAMTFVACYVLLFIAWHARVRLKQSGDICKTCWYPCHDGEDSICQPSTAVAG